MSARQTGTKPLTLEQKHTLRRVRRQGILPVERPVRRPGRNTLVGRGLMRFRREGVTQAGYVLTDKGRKEAASL